MLDVIGVLLCFVVLGMPFVPYCIDKWEIRKMKKEWEKKCG